MTPDVDAIVARLKERVEERRKAGVYPPELEDELQAHFERIARYRTEPNIDAVRAALADLENRIDFSMERIPLESGLPGGERMHRALAKMQSRQIEGVLHQVWEFATGVRAVLEALTAATEDPNSHVHPDVLDQLDAVLDRLAAYERGVAPDGDKDAEVAELRRRIERLEAAEARRRFRPFFNRADMVAALGGPQAGAGVAARFTDAAPVLELWCGRGDFLAQLRVAGVEAAGVEEDTDLAAAAEARGLVVEAGDPVEVLAGRADGSLGGLVLIHAVEHMAPQAVADTVLLAADKLRPGGIAVCQTATPDAVVSVANPMPLHAVGTPYLEFLFRQAGFSAVEVAADTRAPSVVIVTATR